MISVALKVTLRNVVFYVRVEYLLTQEAHYLFQGLCRLQSERDQPTVCDGYHGYHYVLQGLCRVQSERDQPTVCDGYHGYHYVLQGLCRVQSERDQPTVCDGQPQVLPVYGGEIQDSTGAC